MNSSEILSIYKEIANDSHPDIFKESLDKASSGRPLSFSVNGSAFGDEGKGAVALKINELMISQDHDLVGIGTNGGANAGHEAVINGVEVLTSQVPIAIASERATALITRDKVVDVNDLVLELARIKKQLGVAQLPGDLIIDGNAILALSTHRAYEAALHIKGSTGRGIGPAHASVYERTSLLLKNLIDDQTNGRTWEEIMREHYKFYQQRLAGHGIDLATSRIPTLSSKDNVPVGSENEFIDQLRDSRTQIAPFISHRVHDLLEEIWDKRPNTAVVFEYSQAPGLDPKHGIRPDTTSSRPLTRFVNDPTYNVVQLEDIRVPVGVTKTYMSSVGSRILPTEMDAQESDGMRKANNEFGKVSGRPRDVYEVSIPMMQYFRKADGYKYLVITHLDSSQEKIPVVTHYVDKVTGKEARFSPYQEDMDRLKAVVVEFDGWDNEQAKNAKTPDEFPIELRRFASFLSKTVAPIAMGTTGPQKGAFVSWLPDLQ